MLLDVIFSQLLASPCQKKSLASVAGVHTPAEHTVVRDTRSHSNPQKRSLKARPLQDGYEAKEANPTGEPNWEKRPASARSPTTAQKNEKKWTTSSSGRSS